VVVQTAWFLGQTSIWRVTIDGMMTVEVWPEAAPATRWGDQVRLVTIPAAAQLLGASRSKL